MNMITAPLLAVAAPTRMPRRSTTKCWFKKSILSLNLVNFISLKYLMQPNMNYMENFWRKNENILAGHSTDHNSIQQSACPVFIFIQNERCRGTILPCRHFPHL